VEVIAVDTIINYARYTGISFADAKYFATYTLIAMIVSYSIGIFVIPKYITQRKVLSISASLGIAFTLLCVTLPGTISIWFIALLGLANALMWPSIWPLSLAGLGKFTSKGSALLIMGVVGGAISPLLYGTLSDSFNPRVGYWILVPFYLFLLYFSLIGFRVRRRFLVQALN
jgi:fucose permease